MRPRARLRARIVEPLAVGNVVDELTRRAYGPDWRGHRLAPRVEVIWPDGAGMPDQPHPPHQPTRPPPNSASAASETLGDPFRDRQHGQVGVGTRIVGMTEASATNRLVNPWTHPLLSTTVSGSVSGPIRQVRPDARSSTPPAGIGLELAVVEVRTGRELAVAEFGHRLGAGQPTRQPDPVDEYREVVAVPVGEEPVIDHRDRFGVG